MWHTSTQPRGLALRGKPGGRCPCTSTSPQYRDWPKKEAQGCVQFLENWVQGTNVHAQVSIMSDRVRVVAGPHTGATRHTDAQVLEQMQRVQNVRTAWGDGGGGKNALRGGPSRANGGLTIRFQWGHRSLEWQPRSPTGYSWMPRCNRGEERCELLLSRRY